MDDDVLAIIIAFLAMCLVIYLSYVASKYMAKGSSKMYTTKYIKLVDRLALGKDRYIFILKISGKNYLTAVTDEKIEILKEFSDDELVEQQGSEKGIIMENFKNTLTDFMSKKNKK